ncbi:MAG: hypothetical protein ACRCTY_07210, partial [Candidatus Adiutrix sp.]
WLLALGWRESSPLPPKPLVFNLLQIGLLALTVAALIAIYMGIEHGLLQNPNMFIKGGQSYGQQLRWFTDRSLQLPQVYVLSVSVWFYKALMLIWSLWLALSLINWLKWGWASFSKGSLWKKFSILPKTEK